MDIKVCYYWGRMGFYDCFKLWAFGVTIRVTPINFMITFYLSVFISAEVFH